MILGWIGKELASSTRRRSRVDVLSFMTIVATFLFNDYPPTVMIELDITFYYRLALFDFLFFSVLEYELNAGPVVLKNNTRLETCCRASQ